ncbi:MAG: DUF1360 domain-containing protein [Patescibacteria group bacterium]
MLAKIDFWHIGFTIFFLVLLWICYGLVHSAGATMWRTSQWEFFLLSLAAFRLTRFVVYDSITKWFRDLFEGAAPHTFRGTVDTLVNCAWCTGLWAALVVTVAYFAWEPGWYVILILALGGAASFFQIVANLVGWHAEFKKRATVGTGETNYGSKCG